MAMSEIVSRQIFELQEKIRKAEDKIKAIEDLIKQLEEMAEKATPIEKYYWYPRRIARERMSIGALRSHIARWQRKIEELKKALPPFKYQSIEKTFTIETERGQGPFECEITATTLFPADITPAEREEKLKRINNACLKYFFILFDSYKDIGKPGPHSEVANTLIRRIGREAYDHLYRFMTYLQLHLPPVSQTQYEQIKWLLTDIRRGVAPREEVLYVTEMQMDAFLTELMKAGGLKRPPEEYTIYEAILKVSVTPPLPIQQTQPQYPECLLYIEKRTEPPFTAFRKILIAPSTAIDMLSILNMREEYE
jgi:hypothetical protein